MTGKKAKLNNLLLTFFAHGVIISNRIWCWSFSILICNIITKSCIYTLFIIHFSSDKNLCNRSAQPFIWSLTFVHIIMLMKKYFENSQRTYLRDTVFIDVKIRSGSLQMPFCKVSDQDIDGTLIIRITPKTNTEQT